MAADNEMTIVIRARDQATAVLKQIGAAGRTLLLTPFTLVGRVIDGIYRRFFSLRSLLVGGGIIALLRQGVAGLADERAALSVPLFTDDTQQRINKVQSAISRLGASLRSLFGRNLANASDDITGIIDAITDFLTRHQAKISMFFKDAIDFFREAAKFIRAIGSGQVKIGDILGLASGWDENVKAARQRISEGLNNQGIIDEVERLRDAFEQLGAVFDGFASGDADEMTHVLRNQLAALQRVNPEYHRLAIEANMAASAARELAEASGNEAGGTAAALEAARKVLQKYAAELQQIPPLTREVVNALVDLRQVAAVFADNVTDGFFAMIEGTKSVADAFRDMIGSILKDLGRLLIHAGLLRLFQSLLGIPQTPLTNIFGLQGRQHGGPVSGNRPYVVGERGPELFFPGKSGYVSPNGGGGNFTVVNNFHGPANPHDVEKATSRALSKLLETSMPFRRKLKAAT